MLFYQNTGRICGLVPTEYGLASARCILTHQEMFLLNARGFFAHLDEDSSNHFPLKFEMKNCKA